MKKTDWTDRMLAALVELYPVETTAYTCCRSQPERIDRQAESP